MRTWLNIGGALLLTCGLGGHNLASAAPVSYAYGSLNRLTEASHGNGQQVISYSYDDAGNMVSRSVTVAEQLPPVLTIDSPPDGALINAPSLIVAGTASDSGQGESSISSALVNAAAAGNGTAIGADTANWSLDVGSSLAVGASVLHELTTLSH